MPRTLPTTIVATAAAAALTLPLGLATPSATGAPDRTDRIGTAERHGAADLDILFVGAHPDDEAFALSTYGQWSEDYDAETGVMTITRGEGGGNAVGPEEGPALGLIREAEERRAVAYAGITDVYNLDEVDFYYTVSAPLTEQVWGRRDTLDEVVRVVRQTQPEVIVTMDPAPSPGNHGNHQYAARLALEAWRAAADRTAFPSQLTTEGLETWSADKMLLGSARGTRTGTGPDCPTSFEPERTSQDVYGVWSGRQSQRWDDTWAQVEREAQREYASQGWTVFPDVPDDPQALPCDFFTQVDARVPYVRGDLTESAADPATILRGSLLFQPSGLPLGTRLAIDAEPYSVVPGGSTVLTVRLTAPADRALGRAGLDFRAPAGWEVTGATNLGRLGEGERVVRRITVTAPEGADTNEHVAVETVVEAGARSGSSTTEVEVLPLVSGEQQLLPQVRQFEEWTARADLPQLNGFVRPVLPLESGGARRVAVDVTNNDDAAHTGEVSLELPAGFATTPASQPYDLDAREKERVAFRVTNTDPTLPTSNQGGEGGDYGYELVTTVDGAGPSSTEPALELVPTTAIEEATGAPEVDGEVSTAEYGTETLNLSRLWEGTACESAADCSATGHLTRVGNRLFVGVEVTDQTLGTPLEPSDCKRHWRTDSVEIAIDPTGDSENTSTTFKMAVLPRTDSPSEAPCYERDADAEQGPGEEVAPGVDIASSIGGGGYVVEASIPARELPDTVDVDGMGLNLFVYDSDTQDKTGQTRIGWSTWGGVQGDPYRWGVATLPGWDAPTVEAGPPDIPTEALQSVRSPQSIAQAARTGVALAGEPAAAAGERARLVGRPTVSGNDVSVRVRAQGPGLAHLFVYDRTDGTLRSERHRLSAGTERITLEVDSPADVTGARVLLGWQADAGGTWSTATRIR